MNDRDTLRKGGRREGRGVGVRVAEPLDQGFYVQAWQGPCVLVSPISRPPVACSRPDTIIKLLIDRLC